MSVQRSSRWDWIERISLFLGMILGATAFYWQLQERAADREENLISVYSRVELRDSQYIIALDLLNVGKRTAHVRTVSLNKPASARNQGRVRAFELDSAGQVIERPNGLLVRIFQDSIGAC
jgi:hypothetical protein